jgi:O-antigen ligase
MMSGGVPTVGERLLRASGAFLPALLAAAFTLSYYTNIGTLVILGLSAWYIALGWRKVAAWPWALAVIGLFALVALKDGMLLLLGEGGFRSFAKSGSRIVSLAGAAALLASHPRERVERAFETALGITLGFVLLAFVAARAGIAPWLFNTNALGMLGAWYPLVLAARLRRGADARARRLAVAILVIGFLVFLWDVLSPSPGSRTAIPAYLLGAAFVLAPRGKHLGRAGATLVVLAMASSTLLSQVFVPRLDELLSRRQQIWSAFVEKGLERPILGWGYTEEDDNRRLVGPLLEGRSEYESFMRKGLGAHNAFISMFFENGLVAVLVLVALLAWRARRMEDPPGPFDVSLMAYLVFMSMDAFSAGGITFLGYYLGICLLALPPESRP